MSQVAYCREHGLNTKTFGNWVRKYRAGQVIYWSGQLKFEQNWLVAQLKKTA
jgi:transposase-like protein